MIDARFLGVYVGVFGTLGTGAGVVGFLSVRWAESVYLVAAGGDMVQTLGPVFSGFVVFQTSVFLQFLALVLAFVFGFVFGSREYGGRAGALVGGAGGLVGYVPFVLPAIGLLLVAPTASQVFPPSSLLPVVAGSFLLSGLTGAVGGFVGAETS